MDASPDAAFEMIKQGLVSVRYVNYFVVCGVSLLFIDFLSTFPAEVRLMWPAPRSIPKILFLVVRYFSLIQGALALVYSFPTGLSPQQCRARFLLVVFSAMLLMLGSEVILLFRLYAFSGKDKRLLTFLCLQIMAMTGAAVGLSTQFVRRLLYVELPIPNTVCMPVQADGLVLGGIFALLLCNGILAMFYMLYITLRKYGSFNNSLITMFHRDGIFYFVSLSALALANLVVSFRSKDGMKFLLAQPESSLHAILSTRMILHLRKWSEREHVQGKVANSRGNAWRMGGFSASEGNHDRSLANWVPIQFRRPDVTYTTKTIDTP